MNALLSRRQLVAAGSALGVSSLLSQYRALAAPVAKQVKITDVKVMLVHGLFDWPMVKIETDAGIVGIGESYWGRGVKDIMLGYLRPLLIGEDPLDVDRLCTKMISRTGGAGATAGTTVTAMSGIEIALWDTVGKILGVPVCKLLGGQYRSAVRAYWTQHPNNMLDKGSCRDFAAMLKQHPYGFKGVKVDYLPRTQDAADPFSRRWSSKDIRSNVTGFENIRDAVGDDIEIAFHCHWEFDEIDALTLARAIEPMKPAWLEDPMPPDYSSAWPQLTASSPIPVLTGENLYTRQGFRPFIVNHGANIVQIDIPKAGGLLEARKISDLAELYYIPTNAHNVASPIGTLASAHAAASMRDFRGHEFNVGHTGGKQAFWENWEKFAIYDRPFIKDGNIQISNKPGLGVELNEDYVRAHLAPGEVWWG